jgi:K+-transporting ATPase c subunit
MQGARLPAVLKQNWGGTRWFQSRPSERNPNYKPESAAHEMTKIWMVQALPDAGY